MEGMKEYGTQMFSGPFRNNSTRMDFDQTGIAGLSLSTILVHIILYINGDSSLPETSSLSKFFRDLGLGEAKIEVS